MSEETARQIATEKLIAIFTAAMHGSNQQMEAVAALGRVGGAQAARKLISVYANAPTGSNLQLAAIRALGDVGSAG